MRLSTHSGNEHARGIFISSLDVYLKNSSKLVEQYEYHRNATFCVQPSSAYVCHHCSFVLLNIYTLEIFLVLLIIEFLVLVELTKPSMINTAWRKNIAVFVVICVIVFALILYQRTATILK